MSGRRFSIVMLVSIALAIGVTDALGDSIQTSLVIGAAVGYATSCICELAWGEK